MLKHLDLFSGIGGFALAAMTVWGKDYECVGFCDIEPYAQQLLKIRFPGVPIHADIKKMLSWELDKNAVICYSNVCEQLNNEQQILTIYKRLKKQKQENVLTNHVSIAEKLCPYLKAWFIGLIEAEQNIVHGSAEQKPCAEKTPQTQTAENGCLVKIIPTIKTEKDMSGAVDTKKLKFRNGEDVFSQKINIPVKTADYTQENQDNLTHTTLKNGQTSQNCDLNYQTELLYVRNAIKNFIPCKKRRIKIDLLTGGFPCQPFSTAGKRKGTTDDRHLWPFMLDAIEQTTPTFLILENVAGILNMAQSGGDTDLESETDNAEQDNRECGADGIIWGIVNSLEQIGYSVQTFVIPACAVQAPHRRDRVWIVGYATGERYTEDGGVRQGETTDTERTDRTDKSGIVAYSDRSRGGTSAGADNGNRQAQDRGEQSLTEHSGQGGNDTHAERQGLTGCGRKGAGQPGQFSGTWSNERAVWTENWLEVATRLCGVDDGLPAELDGFKLSKAGHRVARIKGLGNSIVSQVAIEIMRAIKFVDNV